MKSYKRSIVELILLPFGDYIHSKPSAFSQEAFWEIQAVFFCLRDVLSC